MFQSSGNDILKTLSFTYGMIYNVQHRFSQQPTTFTDVGDRGLRNVELRFRIQANIRPRRFHHCSPDPNPVLPPSSCAHLPHCYTKGFGPVVGGSEKRISLHLIKNCGNCKPLQLY